MSGIDVCVHPLCGKCDDVAEVEGLICAVRQVSPAEIAA